MNLIVLFLLSFKEISVYFIYLEYIDNILILFFAWEMLVKIRVFGWRTYFGSVWNRLDFFIVSITTPSLIFYFFDLPDFSILLIFRALRVFKFFYFLKIIPHMDTLLNGVVRAIKASVFMFLTYLLFHTIISLFTCYLLKELAPTYFGNGWLAFYNMFKLFTLEGWYDIPENIAPSYTMSFYFIFFIRVYFVFLVISGGIFGLSMVNAVFVNEMVSDNNDELRIRVKRLENKIEILGSLLKNIHKNNRKE